MKFVYLEPPPDNVPPEYFIPICLMLWVSYFMLGFKERHVARKVFNK